MARLQSFDDDFVFQGNYEIENAQKQKISLEKMVSEATPPLVVKQIGEEILKNL